MFYFSKVEKLRQNDPVKHLVGVFAKMETACIKKIKVTFNRSVILVA